MRLGLAPMEGVTDFGMRLWFQLIGGMDSIATPFLRVTETAPVAKQRLAWGPELELESLRGCLAIPVVPQLMASRVEDFLRTNEQIARGSPTVELNCGCPAKKVVNHRAGSQLLEDPTYFANFVQQLAQRLEPGRLAVKIRTGFNDARCYPQLIQSVAELPLDRLTVHGRTRSQGYRGEADWNLIAWAAGQLAFPVIGSGDITDYSSYLLRVPDSGVHGALIGRGALVNPWVFHDIRQQVETTTVALDLLRTALQVYLSLLQASLDSPGLTKVCNLVLTGAFSKPCARDLSCWQVMREKTRTIASGEDRLCLGRLKYLWSQLSLGLPDPFQDRRFLRAGSVSDFFQLFDATCCGFSPAASTWQEDTKGPGCSKNGTTG